MEQTHAPSPRAHHLAGLDGLRAVAALGVVLTHVSFLTGRSASGVLAGVMNRLDLAVAVFFALSGFLLWRSWASAASTGVAPPRLGSYALNRAARILPAYLLLVVVVLWLLPENRAASASQWWANLTFTQVFVPLTLSPGLTHLWSLSVEAAFYLVLPLLGAALARLHRPWRVWALVGLGLLCLGWPWLRAAAFPGVQADLWLPAYLPWFLVGVVLAELAVAPPAWLRGAPRFAALWLVVAVAAFAVASTPVAGPLLLAATTPVQATTRVVLGAVVALGLLAPLALGAGSGYQRLLSTAPARLLGRWSYGIFLWHLCVLGLVFPVLGVEEFAGNTVLVLVATLALTIPLAAASYALVEEPVRLAVRSFERHRRGSAATPAASSATSISS